MGLLQDKLSKFRLPQLYMERGVYPYFREIDSHQDTEVIMDGKKVLMFGSNSYMGLTYDERIIEAAVAATRKYGTGCAGSRFLNGTLDLHVQLEKELAEFVGKDDALVYSTGFTVNEGVVSCLTDRNDYIICDDRDHASIVDGRRLSFSTQLKYKHNDMEALEKELQKCKPESVKLIVVDGVFSMEGDLANLPEIVRLKDKYNASIMVDEAHGLGVFGRDGRGVCDHFGLIKIQSTGCVTTHVHIYSLQVILLLQQLLHVLHFISSRVSPNVVRICGRLQIMLWIVSVRPVLKSVILKVRLFHFMFVIRIRHSK